MESITIKVRSPTEQKHSPRFKSGIFSGEKNPLDFLCTHSKSFPPQSLSGKCIPELPGLSTFHFPHVLGTECLQLQKSGKATYAGFPGLTY